MSKLTRKEISNKAKANNKLIESLQKENLSLVRQSYLLNDKTSTYHEEERTYGRGKTKRTVLIGMIRYNQYFKDEDTGKKIRIERNQIVKEDGVWVTRTLSNTYQEKSKPSKVKT